MSSNILKGAVAGGVLLTAILASQLYTNVDSDEVVVIQSPVSGSLKVETSPGWAWVGMGSVTHYKRLEQFSFSANSDQGKKTDESLMTTFTDGGTARISGVINWTMPLDPEHILKLHKDYHSADAIDQRLMRQAAQKVIFNIGPTMSSTESNAERRPDIPKFIDDQMLNGLYQTKTIAVDQVDLITGQTKKVNVASIERDDKGQPIYQSGSEIAQYGIQLQPVAINGIIYDDKVKTQIQARQESITNVQISVAHAKQAEQDTITVAQQGMATAAKAKWEQEAINAKEIALAEKDKQVALTNATRDLEVAKQAALTAAQYKQQQILEGEGEAEKKRLIMAANGSLDVKLEAWKEVNLAFADAIKEAKPGAWSPQVVMGQAGGAGTGGTNANALIDMLAAKTARDIGLDMSVIKK